MFFSVLFWDFIQVFQDIGQNGLGLDFPLFLVFGDGGGGFDAGPFFVENFSPSFSVGFIGSLLLLPFDFMSGVEFFHEFFIFQRIFLLDIMNNLVGPDWPDDTLDFVRVDNSGQISVGHNRSMELVAFFQEGLFGDSAEKQVQMLKGGLGPDNESAQLATGCQL